MKDICNYVYDTYGRFPAFSDPMFLRFMVQAHHLDLDFYDKYYPPGAYTENHRNTSSSGTRRYRTRSRNKRHEKGFRKLEYPGDAVERLAESTKSSCSGKSGCRHGRSC